MSITESSEHGEFLKKNPNAHQDGEDYTLQEDCLEKNAEILSPVHQLSALISNIGAAISEVGTKIHHLLDW